MTSDISPLYFNLKKDLKAADLSSEERDEFITKIKLLDEKGIELVYVIIRLYEIETTKMLSEFPYESTLFSKNELRFNLESLPIPLKHIISKFLTLHLDKMKEDCEISSSRKKIGC